MSLPPPEAAHIFAKLKGVRPSGTGWKALCCAHDDAHASLSVTIQQSTDGRRWCSLKCFTGCTRDAICAALGIRPGDLWLDPKAAQHPLAPPTVRTPKGAPYAVAAFAWEGGEARHMRQDFENAPKSMWWEPLGVHPAALPLYRWQHVREADMTSKAILVVEGEICAEAAAKAAAESGFVVVATVTGASGTPCDDALSILLGQLVTLWPDNDTVGRQHMDRIAAWLVKMQTTPPMLVLWGDKAGDDIADAIAGGVDVARLLGDAEVWEPPAEQSSTAPNNVQGRQIAAPGGW